MTAPITKNAARHDSQVINAATIGGVTALPSRENECVKPCTTPRRSRGNQWVIARAWAGSVAPSPMPSSRRAANSSPRLCTNPVAKVDTTQISPQPISVMRAPNRSAIQPPPIWQIAYEYANAENATPSSVFDRPSSALIAPAAVARLTRST